MDGKRLRELISAESIADRVTELGHALTRDYQESGRNLVLVGVMKGSVIFLSDLCRKIALPCMIDLIGIASYGDEAKSSGVVKITSDLSNSIEGKDVVVVEDIIDTGLTVSYLLENLKTRQPRSVKVCALLSKPERTIVKVPIDYLGFTIPDQFVVGYGLDFAQRFRNVPFIGVVEGHAD
ncbi:MAG: hypoxanthine phosphoribosyltransferase [Deltaproteobacteria bacterium]|nr:hypoxanthine phosphoribosyltransferase [Deltaproteobacteria bacterium]